MTTEMESNKWLWQPHENGPVYIRFSYRDLEGRKRIFARSLGTNSWQEARRIRDVEYAPIMLDIDKARQQVNIILTRFPQLVKQLETGLHGGLGERTRRKSGVTLEDLHAEWSAAIAKPEGNFSVAARTARRYKTICGRFVDHLKADKLLAETTPPDVAGYRDSRLNEGGASKKTADLELIAIRSMFRYAVEKMGLADNPADKVSVRRTKAERIRERRRGANRPPTHDEARQICEEFPGTHRTYRVENFQDYALFARYTGMRQGEIAQLRVEYLQVFEGAVYADAIQGTPENYRLPYDGAIPEGHCLCIYVVDTDDRRTKTGLERIVPVAAKLKDTLDRWLGEVKRGPLFAFAVKDSGASFGRTWLKRVKKIHSELTMHGFRHYATSEMENAGVNAAVARAILGHVQAGVHEGYVHVQVNTLQAAVDKIH